MAADRRYRQQNRVTSDREKFYVYGNAVRQAEVQPKRRQEVRPAKTGKTSSQVMRNRNRAMKISPAYAIFFILAAVCTVAVCVVYIRLQDRSCYKISSCYFDAGRTCGLDRGK